jgi:hypothetical protein
MKKNQITILTAIFLLSCHATSLRAEHIKVEDIPSGCSLVRLYQHGAYTSRITYKPCQGGEKDTTTVTAGRTENAIVKNGPITLELLWYNVWKPYNMEDKKNGEIDIQENTLIDCGKALLSTPKCDITALKDLKSSKAEEGSKTK